MKKYIVLGVVLISGMIFAQDKQLNQPKLEVVGNMVKATYLFENGQVQQQGFFENGKLQGEWVSYDLNGNKKALGEYNEGKKTGKWFFWNGSVLNEVDYSDNRIASIKNWKQDALVNID